MDHVSDEFVKHIEGFQILHVVVMVGKSVIMIYVWLAVTNLY